MWLGLLGTVQAYGGVRDVEDAEGIRTIVWVGAFPAVGTDSGEGVVVGKTTVGTFDRTLHSSVPFRELSSAYITYSG